jgi:hypothetical protein
MKSSSWDIAIGIIETNNKIMRTNLYTQNAMDCTLYTILNILRTKYWILFNDTQIKDFINTAKEKWIYSETSWAIFTFIYNFATWYFKKYWIELDLVVYDLLSEEAKSAHEKGESFWIGLLYAWNFYKRVRADETITMDEIKQTDTSKEKFYWHNQCYKLNTIIDTLESVKRKIVNMNFDVLQEAIRKKIYYQTARTFKITDSILDYYLKELNKWTKFIWIEFMDDKNKKAIEKAIKLRWCYLKKD